MLLHQPLFPLNKKPAAKALRIVRERRMPVPWALTLKKPKRALVMPKNSTMATM